MKEITFQPLTNKVTNLYKKVVYDINEEAKETLLQIAIISEKSDSNKVTIYYKDTKVLFHMGVLAGRSWNNPFK